MSADCHQLGRRARIVARRNGLSDASTFINYVTEGFGATTLQQLLAKANGVVSLNPLNSFTTIHDNDGMEIKSMGELVPGAVYAFGYGEDFVGEVDAEAVPVAEPVLEAAPAETADASSMSATSSLASKAVAGLNFFSAGARSLYQRARGTAENSQTFSKLEDVGASTVSKARRSAQKVAKSARVVTDPLASRVSGLYRMCASAYEDLDESGDGAVSLQDFLSTVRRRMRRKQAGLVKLQGVNDEVAGDSGDGETPDGGSWSDKLKGPAARWFSMMQDTLSSKTSPLPATSDHPGEVIPTASAVDGDGGEVSAQGGGARGRARQVQQAMSAVTSKLEGMVLGRLQGLTNLRESLFAKKQPRRSNTISGSNLPSTPTPARRKGRRRPVMTAYAVGSESSGSKHAVEKSNVDVSAPTAAPGANKNKDSEEVKAETTEDAEAWAEWVTAWIPGGGDDEEEQDGSGGNGEVNDSGSSELADTEEKQPSDSPSSREHTTTSTTSTSTSTHQSPPESTEPEFWKALSADQKDLVDMLVLDVSASFESTDVLIPRDETVELHGRGFAVREAAASLLEQADWNLETAMTDIMMASFE